MALDNLRGALLVAGPALLDPNFHRTVVLVGEHNDEGALGVILNRPTPLLVRDAVPPLAWLPMSDDRLYQGGPVQPSSPVVLGEFEHPDDAGLLVFGTVGFVLSEAEEVRSTVRRARVFAGYAGWGPGQLERELEEGSWVTEPPGPLDVFPDDPEAQWSAVLRRKGGTFAVWSLMPIDPSVN